MFTRASFLLTLEGMTFASTGSQGSGVAFKDQVITLMALFSYIFILPVCEL